MSGAQASANGGLRFLIVDDSRSAASVMTALLSRYAVCQKAFDGVEGLKAFQKSVEHDDAFDLICLDIMMPEMDGISVLQEIRRIESERGLDPVKVVMITAQTARVHVQAAVDAGASGFLVKPIERAKLVECLRDLGTAGA